MEISETGCKIMVRGKGSMRDKKKEDANRGKPNWEHLNEDLHVLIQCEDSPNRLEVKLARAIAEVQKLLVPSVSIITPSTYYFTSIRPAFSPKAKTS